ncbi:TM2 domain-containing protein [Ferrimonas kyonanensis]|uniref:TM2 domain-containing protein n=1 Tax=Ferrimonas kyonanensis TaxID=364763 RepID=UPI00041BEE8D|nr:TM2 domain-containing protein [Ferrimonas kyonanensis]
MQHACSQCGTKLDLEMIVCSGCGAGQHMDAFAGVDPDVKLKSRRKTAWLSLFLGGFGAHKFYLGQPFKGTAYLLFCWTLVPSALGVIEAIRTFKMTSLQFHFRQRQLA